MPTGRDSYPIFERDAHGFPVRVRWIDRSSVPSAFLGAYVDPDALPSAGDAGASDAHTASGAPDSDPAAHGAT